MGAVPLNTVGTVPAPFVLNNQLLGQWYNVRASKVEVLDAKTLRLSGFSFQGTKPPGLSFIT